MNGWVWVRLGAVLGFLAVGLGAFGAHSLKDRLETSNMTATYQTAAHYQMDHALAIVAVGLFGVAGRCNRAVVLAGWAFLVGVILFSGSLYALAISGVTKLGIITPFGGLAFLAGWAALIVGASKPKDMPEGQTRPSKASAPELEMTMVEHRA
jgi:uncharacterized membrane protein YgdD (TMEM256/DUF423 family)